MNRRIKLTLFTILIGSCLALSNFDFNKNKATKLPVVKAESVKSTDVDPNENLFGKIIMSKMVCDRLINCSKFTYLTMVKNYDGYSEICGDIIFTLAVKNDNIIGNGSLNGSKGSAPLLYKIEFYNNLPNQSF